MRSNFAFFMAAGFAALAGLSTSSCTSSGPAGVYADIRWQIRCDVMNGCSSYPARDVNGFSGDNGVRVTCTTIESAANRVLSFSVSGSGYSLRLAGASFARNGGSPMGSGCLVTVQEDNVYEGACGASPPSDAQPCRVSDVMFTRDADGRSLITGGIFCQGLSPSAAPGIDRELTASGTSAEATMSPLEFNLYDCNGYTPD